MLAVTHMSYVVFLFAIKHATKQHMFTVISGTGLQWDILLAKQIVLCKDNIILYLQIFF